MKKEIKHVDLSKITSPEFLKDLSYKELDVLSSDIASKIVETTSIHGGHLSSNLGVVDATIALCRSFDFAKDKIIFDVGHQTYTYKILTGRNLDNLRTTGGVSGFQKMSESIYDHFECGHSSTSISAAQGMAIARDLRGENYQIVSFIGDASIVNGMAFEALNNGNSIGHKTIIILNDNGMSISPSKGAVATMFRKFSTSNFYIGSKKVYRILHDWNPIGRAVMKFMRKIKNAIKSKVLSINLFDIMGYKMIGPIDGHDIAKMEKAFAKAKKMNDSCVVYIKTKKGKGYKFAEDDVHGDWHGVNAFDVKTGKANPTNCITWSECYGNILYDAMKANDKLICIVPGTLIGSSLSKVEQGFPKRFYDVGIAEEHAITLGSGLAISNYHPIISMYSTFLQRGYDQISHDLARMNCGSTLLIDRCGLVGFDGETHQGLYDEAFLLTIPNVVITMATCQKDAEGLFKESLNNHGVFAIRSPRECLYDINDGCSNVTFGKWNKLTSGGSTAIVSVGPATIKLKKQMEDSKKEATLYKALFISPMDEGAIKELLNYKKVIIYDSYATVEGFAKHLAARLVELDYKGKVIIKAVPNEFVKMASISEQRNAFHISVSDIIEEL